VSDKGRLTFLLGTGIFTATSAWGVVACLGPGRDEETIPGACVREFSRRASLEDQLLRAYGRAARRQELLLAVLGGSLPFARGAELLQEYLQEDEPPNRAAWVLESYPGKDNYERAGHALLSHLKGMVPPGPDADRVIERITQELSAYLAKRPAKPVIHRAGG
jgi:hypothetical protein